MLRVHPRKSGVLCSSIVAGALCCVLPAASQLACSAIIVSPITFAQYEENEPLAANAFAYTQPLTGNGGTLAAAGVPVTFDFESLGTLPTDLAAPQSALLTLTSSSDQAVVTGFGGMFGQQSFDGTDTLSITRTTPALEGTGAKTNLLTMTFTGQLTGALGGHTAALSGQTNLGYTVTYTSDFLTFPNGQKDYSLNFTSWDTTADGNGLETPPAALTSFLTATAASTGSFDSVSGIVLIPEPASIALLSLSAMALVSRRRRRTI